MPTIVIILLAVLGGLGIGLGTLMNRPDPPRPRPSISRPQTAPVRAPGIA